MLKQLFAAVTVCIVLTILVRHGPLEPNGTAERSAILIVWIGGLAWLMRQRARRLIR